VSTERRNLLIAIVVSFVFGISGGVLGTRGAVAWMQHLGGPHGSLRGPGPSRAPGARGAGRARGHRRPPMERFVHRELDLSDPQEARIEEILDAARPRYAAVRESTHAEIQRVLTDAQRTKWRELEERFPERRRGPSRP
jgi:hypothetical protein